MYYSYTFYLPNKNTLDNCKDTNSDIISTRYHIYAPVGKSFPLWITEMQIKQQTNYYNLRMMFVYFNKLIPCICILIVMFMYSIVCMLCSVYSVFIMPTGILHLP